jgi:hypothetical protein
MWWRLEKFSASGGPELDGRKLRSGCIHRLRCSLSGRPAFRTVTLLLATHLVVGRDETDGNRDSPTRTAPMRVEIGQSGARPRSGWKPHVYAHERKMRYHPAQGGGKTDRRTTVAKLSSCPPTLPDTINPWDIVG